MGKKKSIIDKVKTFKDACGILEISYADPICLINKRKNKILITERCKKDDDLFFVSCSSEFLSKQEVTMIAFYKLTIITKALNEGWEPDFDNEKQYRYYPYFNAKSGFGFSNTLYVYPNTSTFVGFRLCFKTRELAEYAGKQFELMYKDYLI